MTRWSAPAAPGVAVVVVVAAAAVHYWPKSVEQRWVPVVAAMTSVSGQPVEAYVMLLLLLRRKTMTKAVAESWLAWADCLVV